MLQNKAAHTKYLLSSSLELDYDALLTVFPGMFACFNTSLHFAFPIFLAKFEEIMGESRFYYITVFTICAFC